MTSRLRFIAVLGTWLLSHPAHAYDLGSGVTDPCHEELTLASLDVLVDELDDDDRPVPLPRDDRWQRAADELFSILPQTADPGRSEPEERFLAFSLLLGVRNPDTAGHSISSPNALRRVHAAAEPSAQHIHCLRAENDDGPKADQEALASAKTLLTEKLTLAADGFSAPDEEALLQVSHFFEFSGQVDLEVHAGAFFLGEGLHLLQDSFAHTIRTNDTREILAVLNFVEAANGTISEKEDGLAHSRAMDQCRDTSLLPLLRRAEQVSVAATTATLDLSGGDDSGLVLGLERCGVDADADSDACGWLSYAEACEQTPSTDQAQDPCCDVTSSQCDSEWGQKARESPTQPIFGCSASGAGRGKTNESYWLLFLALALLARRHYISDKRPASTPLLLGALLLFSRGASAQPVRKRAASHAYLALEAHGSLLSGQAGRGLPDVAFGPGVRGGVQPEPSDRIGLGYFALIEQSNLVATETATHVLPFLLDIGVGIELSYFDVLRGSLAAGPSVLLSNTVAHDAPQLGLFVDLRPLGFRFPLGKHLRFSLDPLTLLWAAPALTDPMVSALRYRLVLGVEWLP